MIHVKALVLAGAVAAGLLSFDDGGPQGVGGHGKSIAEPHRPPPRQFEKSAADPRVPVPSFLYERNTFHLADGVFFLLLFDTPKALLVRSKATFLAADESFYYYRDSFFQNEWAFAKEPRDSFANHAVWTRRQGANDWELRSAEAIMATPYGSTAKGP